MFEYMKETSAQKYKQKKNKHNTAKVTITCKFCRKHSFIPRETFL